MAWVCAVVQPDKPVTIRASAGIAVRISPRRPVAKPVCNCSIPVTARATCRRRRGLNITYSLGFEILERTRNFAPGQQEQQPDHDKRVAEERAEAGDHARNTAP